MTDRVFGSIPDLNTNMTEWLGGVLQRSLQSAIEEHVRRLMPEIVSLACADVTAEMSNFISYERMGTDLRITVMNAYKPEPKR